MIETLPLLPSTWAEWDWSTSNGTATDEQMALGHIALLYQGYCSGFSRHIWNDLVDAVADVIEQAGLEWDSSYCSASDCQITQALGSLTATMFNSVALNIHRFGMVAWKWSMQPSTKGYVGRDEFRGHSTHGANADFLYGWYIIELTNKLNRVIEVLKDEANFGEFATAAQINSVELAPLFGAKAGVLVHVGESNTFTSTALAKAGILTATAYVSDYSYHNGILIRRSPLPMVSNIISSSKPKATGESLITAAMDSIVPSETFSDSTLLPLVFVGYMRHIAHIETKAVAEVDISNIKNLVVSLLGKSYEMATLVKALSYPIEGYGHGFSHESANLITVDRTLMNATPFSESHVDSLPVIQLPQPMVSNTAEYSTNRTTLHRLYPLYIQRSIRDYSYSIAKANVMESLPIYSISESRSYDESSMVAKGVQLFDYAGLAKSLVEATARCIVPAYVIAAPVSEDFVNSTLVELPSFLLSTYEKTVSKTDAVLQKGIPVVAETAEQSDTYETGHLVTLPEKNLKAVESGHTKNKAAIKAASANALNVIHIAKSVTCCEMDLEYNSQSAWKDPIQSGNNVYIRSAHPQWQEGNNVRLDSGGTFYEAEQTGNNVYIRSVDSLKGV